MKKKVALKRLSASDLTLFEYHYRNTAGAKQKAINLDSSVFVNTFFPGLPNRFSPVCDRVILTLTIYGPDAAASHSITRKILKQQKNWRLNGELISNPPEEPSRYNSLSKGDYAILEFTGDAEPQTARMYLVAQQLAKDAPLHLALESAYGDRFSSRVGMAQVDVDDLAKVLGQLQLVEGHPALDIIDADALEDAASGGLEGIRRLRQQRQGRGVSREELARARQNADQIGRMGEEVLNAWLDAARSDGSGPEFRWEADQNAIAPYDFALVENGVEFRRIDAKSTAGDFKNPIHVSIAELIEMAEGATPYDLYRLYFVTELSARLRVAKDQRSLADNILKTLEQLPEGIVSDGVTIKPDALNFGDEVTIQLSDDKEDNL